MTKQIIVAFAIAMLTGAADGQQPTMINLGTQGRNIDFGNAPVTRPVKTGSALPATCAIGDLFFSTTAPAGQNLFGCSATNTWTLLGAAAGLNDPGANGLVVRTAADTTTAVAAPAGNVVGTTDAQTLTNKSINASEINAGTLLSGVLPAFSGDISTSAGSTTTSLATVNSSPGTFGDSSHALEITVDGKGRVTSVTAVAASGGISALTGDVTASGSGSVAATLAASGVTAGTYGDASHVPQVTFDAKGRATGVASIAISAGSSGITQLTGDVTTPSGSGSQPATLATVNAAPGACGDATHVCQVTTNGKGLVTGQTAVVLSSNGITQLTGDGTTPSGSGSQPLTLATVNSSPGACGDATHVCQVTTNGKGLVTGQTPVVLSASGITQLTGDGTTPSGSGSQPLTLATVNTGSGVCGDATHVCQVTTNGKGLVTAQTPVALSAGSGITQLTGDVTTPSGSGSQAATLATVNSNVGSYGSSTTVPVITVNGKGLITGVSTVTITGGSGGGAIPAGPLASIGSTCTAGSLYFATDQPAGQQIYTCSSTNTWTQIVNLGGSGALAYTGGSLDIVTSVVPRLAAANSFTGMNTFSQAPALPQSTPASSSATCTAGQLWADANYIYSCVATNTIKRAALSSF